MAIERWKQSIVQAARTLFRNPLYSCCAILILWQRRNPIKKVKTGAKRRIQTAIAARRAHRATFGTPLIAIVIAVSVTLLLGFILEACNLQWIRSRGEAQLVLRPSAASWFLLAIPIGIGTALLLWDRVNSFLAGEAPPNFSVEYAVATIPTPSWFRLGTVAMIGFFVLLSLLNVRKHARLTEYAIVEQRALGWRERVYPYSQVASVRLGQYYVTGSRFSQGGASREPAVFVKLRDGRRWSTKDSELAPGAEITTAFAHQIAARSGLAVDYTNRIIDEPTPDEKKAAIVRLGAFYAVIFVALWFFVRISRRRTRSAK